MIGRHRFDAGVVQRASDEVLEEISAGQFYVRHRGKFRFPGSFRGHALGGVDVFVRAANRERMHETVGPVPPVTVSPCAGDRQETLIRNRKSRGPSQPSQNTRSGVRNA